MYIDRRARAEIARVAWRHRSPRRVWTLATYSLGLLLLRGIGSLARRLDDLLWPEIAEQRIEQPVFLFANARSGTTFLHRLMSLDEERFAHFKLYQSFTWSVSVQRLVDALDRIDERVPGRPLHRAVQWIDRAVFSGWEGIHEMGLGQAEEDEALFALCLCSPSISLLLPFVDELPSVRWFDAHPAEDRHAFLDLYEDALRRRLFSAGGNRTFLDKNALFAPRVRSMHERFPDARFVYLIRHPYESLASFLDMFYVKWITHSPEIAKDSPESRALARLAMDYLRYALDARRFVPADRLLVVRYDELVGEPRATVERIYAWLGAPMSELFRDRLQEQVARRESYVSGHRYSLEAFGLSREDVYVELKAVFDEFGFEP